MCNKTPNLLCLQCLLKTLVNIDCTSIFSERSGGKSTMSFLDSAIVASTFVGCQETTVIMQQWGEMFVIPSHSIYSFRCLNAGNGGYVVYVPQNGNNVVPKSVVGTSFDKIVLQVGFLNRAREHRLFALWVPLGFVAVLGTWKQGFVHISNLGLQVAMSNWNQPQTYETRRIVLSDNNV